MPLISLTSTKFVTRSVSLTSYLRHDENNNTHDCDSDNDHDTLDTSDISSTVIDTNHAHSAVFGQKKIIQKSIRKGFTTKFCLQQEYGIRISFSCIIICHFFSFRYEYAYGLNPIFSLVPSLGKFKQKNEENEVHRSISWQDFRKISFKINFTMLFRKI